MINYILHFPKELTTKIRNEFCTTVMINLERLRENCRVNDAENFGSLSKLSSRKNILRIIFCKPSRFKELIEEVFVSLPVIADRYNPKRIFANGNFNYELLELHASSTRAKEIHSVVKSSLSAELLRLHRDFDSYICSDLNRKLNATNSIGNTKKILLRVKLLASGEGRLTKEEKTLYPSWVQEFYGAFDYELLSRDYGYNLVASSQLSVCPYCNAEEIPLILGAKKTHRPALDHFLPRSKYPFLGISIYNLIPAGNICNTSFKSDIDFLDGYLNPLVSGVEHKSLFNFEFNALLNLVDIRLKKIQAFEKNKNIFELEARYCSPYYEEVYLDIRTNYKILKDLNKNEVDISKDKFLINQFFKMNGSCNKTQNLKFRKEALRHVIFNHKLVNTQEIEVVE
ncbi:MULTISPECIES: hypothetical protein [Pantoea]|uniref:HNH nuclease domain-containing protein n=2 Tax=Pantoea TaxID=53335 RepID=A0A0U3UNZ4_9GAMM|nr:MULTISPECIES: hypothetical protein [Pantoea]ALV92032.1 hypothetical protein LK04_07695 [Pantoea vagans]KHJ66013.1 hypothetical protein QU24_21580 [Pantoea rodasii]